MTIAGFISARSSLGVAGTVQRLIQALAEHDLALIAHVDHGAAAAKAGLVLGPTELLVFGNPRGGTPLMQAAQTIGIDLPLRMLVWADASATTYVGYDDPHWLAARHGIDETSIAVARLADTLAAVARAAIGAP